MKTLQNKAVTLEQLFIRERHLKDLQFSVETFFLCDTLIDRIRHITITESDKIAFGKLSAMIYENALRNSFQLYQQTQNTEYLKNAFYFAEKNKAGVLLEALAGAEAQEFAGIPDLLLLVEGVLNTDINFYQRQIAEAPDQKNEAKYRDKLFYLNRKYDELIAKFEREYPDYYNLKYSDKTVSVEEIQNLLDDLTAMISYFIGDTSIYIFTITSKSLDLQYASKKGDFEDAINDR